MDEYQEAVRGITYIDTEPLNPLGPLDSPMTRHELGQLADEGNGLVPMADWNAAPVRVPLAFPLAAYLVMKRAE